MKEESVLYYVENNICTIQINRPENSNALTQEVKNNLIKKLDKGEEDEQVKIIILTGSGKSFCAGGDIKDMDDLNAVEEVKKITETSKIALKIYTMRKIVIAAVNGYAMGAGFSIALASDMIIADDEAKFGMNFSSVGLIPDCGLMYFLPKIIGRWQAKELVIRGASLSTKQAEEYKFINKKTTNGNCLEETKKFAGELLERPSNVMWFTKNIMRKTFNQDIANTIEYENYAQSILKQTEDHKEGVRAFKEKRKPVFIK